MENRYYLTRKTDLFPGAHPTEERVRRVLHHSRGNPRSSEGSGGRFEEEDGLWRVRKNVERMDSIEGGTERVEGEGAANDQRESGD